MWMDDAELVQVLGEMANVCIVLTKQTKQILARAKVKPLWELAESSGLAQEAYPELAEYAPREGNGPLIVGPGTPNWTEETGIGAVREVGFSRVGGQLVPIVHAKMALLGRMHWTDEHPSGYTVEQLSFIPERLWVSSANFTESSRSGLEMGLWTDDPDLMDGARRFLLGLVALSEPLGTGPDTLNPELLPVRYDDEAFIEYLREHRDDDDWLVLPRNQSVNVGRQDHGLDNKHLGTAAIHGENTLAITRVRQEHARPRLPAGQPSPSSRFIMCTSKSSACASYLHHDQFPAFSFHQSSA